MSSAIQFLETVGSNAALSRLSAAEYAATVAILDVDNAQRKALLDRDHATLNDLLGGRPKMMFGLFPAEEEEAPQKDDDQRDGEPGQDAPPAAE